MQILLTNTESPSKDIIGSVDRVTEFSEVAFFNAAKDYSEEQLNVTEKLKYVVIFVPYGKDFLLYRARAKTIRNQFFGKEITIVDTDQTYKTSINCRLEHDQAPGTVELTIDYLLDQNKSVVLGPDIPTNDLYHKKITENSHD